MAPPTAPDRLPKRWAYLAVANRYLSSAQGADTPLEIAARLLSIPDPAVLGLGTVPSNDQLHRTRLALEDVAYLQAAPEATDGTIAPDETGVFRLAWESLRKE